jgi:hypothetical protein
LVEEFQSAGVPLVVDRRLRLDIREIALFSRQDVGRRVVVTVIVFVVAVQQLLFRQSLQLGVTLIHVVVVGVEELLLQPVVT